MTPRITQLAICLSRPVVRGWLDAEIAGAALLVATLRAEREGAISGDPIEIATLAQRLMHEQARLAGMGNAV